MQKMKTNPFKPGSGLYPPYFAGREEIIKEFERKLTATIEGTPMHMAVIGDWGIGKTSILRRFEKIAEERNCIVVPIIAYPEDTSGFVATTIRKIVSRIKIEIGIKSLKEIEISFGVLKLKFERPSEAQSSLKDFLSNCWDKVKKHSDAMLIEIDDLDIIEDFRDTMLLLRNTAMELAMENCKIFFVVSGTQKLFEKLHKAHEPLIRFFEPVQLSKLEWHAGIDAIKIPLEAVGMEYDIKTIEKIVDISEGHPYYIQEIGDHTFEEAMDEFNKIAFEKGYMKAFSDISRNIFFERLKDASAKEQVILETLAKEGKKTFSQLVIETMLKKGTVATAVKRLRNKGLIKQEDKYYTIPDKLFGEYIKTMV